MAGFFSGSTATTRQLLLTRGETPAGSSLLFGALADSARIKQRQNGSSTHAC